MEPVVVKYSLLSVVIPGEVFIAVVIAIVAHLHF